MFGSNVNKVLKRNFWIITVVWLSIMIVALLELGYGIDITKVIEVNKSISPEILSNTIYGFLKDWGIVYLISLSYMFVVTSINNFILKKSGEIEEESYYRDLIRRITPAQLSYLDNQFVETEKDIVATILNLKLKNKIEFINGEIRLQEGFDYKGLLNSEIHILKCIEERNSPFYDINVFNELIMNELRNLDLIEDETDLFNSIYTPLFWLECFWWTIYGIFIAYLGRFNVFSSNIVNNIIELGMLLAVILLVAPFFSHVRAINANEDSFKKLSNMGKEIRKKLNGLRLFLNDYSDMKNKSLKEIELWDEYMIYSVILNDNKKVQKEVLKMIKEQFK